MSKGANLPNLHTDYNRAVRLWRGAVHARGLDYDSVEAEGTVVVKGRGAKRTETPDELRVLFDAMEAARLAWLGGGQ